MLRHRNVLIDLLRGLSLLMVVGSHFGILPELTPNQHWLGRPTGEIGAGLGYYGVVLFFVISGFLITRLSLERYQTLPQIDRSEFWWRRFARLMPTLALCIAVMVAFSALSVSGFIFRGPTEMARTIAAVLSFHFNSILGGDISPGAWNPLWSISVEEMFYFAFPFVCFFLSGAGTVIWVFLTLIATSVSLSLTGEATPYSTMGCVDFLALGCLLAIFRPDQWFARAGALVRNTLAGLAAIAGAALVVWPVLVASPLGPAWARMVCALGAFFLLLATQLVRPRPWLGILLFPLTQCGIISYEVYLVHIPLRQYFAVQGWTALWPTFLACFGLGWLIHRFYSEPLNRALRQIWAPGKGTAPLTSESSGATQRHYSRLWWLSRFAVPTVLILALGYAARSAKDLSLTIKFLDIKPLSAGVGEPLAKIGGKEVGVLAILQHQPDGRVRLGLDDWGIGTSWSVPLTVQELESEPLTIEFTSASAVILRARNPIVKTTQPPRCRLWGIKTGVNDTGFSTSIPRAESTFAVTGRGFN